MAAELAGLIFSSGLLLAATSWTSSHADEDFQEATNQSQRLVDQEYRHQLHAANTATERSPDQLICLVPRFDVQQAFELLQNALLKEQIQSKVVFEQGKMLHPALDIDLSSYVVSDTGDVDLERDRERVLFTAISRNGVLLCPGSARGVPGSPAGHFYVTSPQECHEKCALIARRIAQAAFNFKNRYAAVPSVVTATSEENVAIKKARVEIAPTTKTEVDTAPATEPGSETPKKVEKAIEDESDLESTASKTRRARKEPKSGRKKRTVADQ